MERRRFQRFALNCNAVCYGAGEKGGIPCSVTDISRKGVMICFHNLKPDSPGPNLFLEIRCRAENELIQTLVHRRWCMAAGDILVIGAQITLMRDTHRDFLFRQACKQKVQSVAAGVSHCTPVVAAGKNERLSEMVCAHCFS